MLFFKSAFALLFFVLARLLGLFLPLLRQLHSFFFFDLAHGLLARLKARLQLGLPLERLLRQVDKCGFDIDIVFGRSFEEVHIDALTELLSLLLRDCPLAFHVALVAQHHERKALR